MAKCPHCGLEDVNTVEAVNAGCNQIDTALEQYADIAATIGKASSILNHNSLQFGGECATLEQALDELQIMINKCNMANEGLTAGIRQAANTQQAEWQADVQACAAKAAEEEAKSNKKK